MPKLKLVTDEPVTVRRYPTEPKFNPDVPLVDWPFAPTSKDADDVVISLAPGPTRRAETTSRLRSWVTGFRSKLCGGRHDQG